MEKIITIELAEYRYFRNKFSTGDFKNQRLGQAFYNHFMIYRMSRDIRTELDALYEEDGSVAETIINELIEFH